MLNIVLLAFLQPCRAMAVAIAGQKQPNGQDECEETFAFAKRARGSAVTASLRPSGAALRRAVNGFASRSARGHESH
jgi:hypothetical protein